MRILLIGDIVGSRRGQHLALCDAEVNLDLRGPSGVHQRGHQDQVPVASLEALSARWPRCAEALSNAVLIG